MFDSVTDLSKNTANIQAYNNLWLGTSNPSGGDFNIYLIDVSSTDIQLWNNVVHNSGTPFQPIRASTVTYVAPPDPNTPVGYMDYNVYTDTPAATDTYHFGGYGAPPNWFTLADWQALGFELKLSSGFIVAGLTDVYVDTTSYVLKPAWQTAGRFGDPVGPRVLIGGAGGLLDATRYGPSAIGGYS